MNLAFPLTAVALTVGIVVTSQVHAQVREEKTITLALANEAVAANSMTAKRPQFRLPATINLVPAPFVRTRNCYIRKCLHAAPTVHREGRGKAEVLVSVEPFTPWASLARVTSRPRDWRPQPA